MHSDHNEASPPHDGESPRDENDTLTRTTRTAHKPDGVEVDEDVVSDPAHDDRIGSDWADEGGATPQGPATSTPQSRDDARAPDGRDDKEDEEDTDEVGRQGTLPAITLDPPD